MSAQRTELTQAPRIIEFEGRLVEVPSDSTDAEIVQILETPSEPAMRGGPIAASPSQLKLAGPAAVAASPPSMTDTIMSGGATAGRLVDRGVRGVAKGLMNVAGLPGDIGSMMHAFGGWAAEKAGLGDAGQKIAANMMPFAAARVLPGSDTLKGGLNSLNNVTADIIGMPRPEVKPRGLAEHIVERTGEELGAAAVPVVGAIGKAASVGVEGARKLPLLARMFVEPAAINPAKFATKEMSTAAAAGVGAGTVTGVLGTEDGSLGNTAADIGGALGGAGLLGIAKAVGRPAKDLIDIVMRKDKLANDVVKNEVVDILSNASTSLEKRPGAPIDTADLVNNIMGGPRTSKVIPGFKESLADRTQDPGIASLEYGRQSGQQSGMFAGQRNDNVRAVDDAIRQLAPTETPGAFRSELQLERERRLTDANVQTTNARGAMDQHIQRLQPAMTGEARGADIRAALENASEGAQDIVNRAWAPLNESGARVSIQPLADRYAQVDQGLSTAERQRFRPAEADIPAQLAEQAPKHAINEVTGLRTALTDAAREARNAGRASEARVIDQHVTALDTYLDGAVPQELRQRYDAGRAATRDYHDRFTRPQTAIAQTLDRQQGQYRQPDSAIASKFVQDDQGRIADFEALSREVGGNSRVRGAIRDQVLQDVRDRGLLENPTGLEEYLGRYNTLFTSHPDLRQELGTAANLRRTLDEATTKETNLTREWGTSDGRPGTNSVGKYLKYGPERSSDAMAAVLNDAKPARAIDELLTSVNDDPKAVEGAKRAFWDLMESKTRSSGGTTATTDGVQPWRAGSLSKFLNDPATTAVAERLYRDNPEHLQNLRKISDALQDVDLRVRAKAPNSSGTPQAMSQVLTPETIQSRLYAYKRGQVSGGFLVTALASVAARRAVRWAQSSAVDRLLNEALLDPELAAVLLKENNPANRAALRWKAKAYLGNEGANVIDAVGGIDETKEDPVKKVIMRGAR